MANLKTAKALGLTIPQSLLRLHRGEGRRASVVEETAMSPHAVSPDGLIIVIVVLMVVGGVWGLLWWLNRWLDRRR